MCNHLKEHSRVNSNSTVFVTEKERYFLAFLAVHRVLDKPVNSVHRADALT